MSYGFNMPMRNRLQRMGLIPFIISIPFLQYAAKHCVRYGTTHKSKLWSIFLVLFFVCTTPDVTYAQNRDKTLTLSFGLAVQTIDTHFHEYNYSKYYNRYGTPAISTYEDFSLRGIKIGLMKETVSETGKWLFGVGGGLGTYVGDYDYEVATNQGSGGDVTASEIDLKSQVRRQIAPQYSLLGQVGVSLWGLTADAASARAPSPYKEDFVEGLVDMYLALGAQYDNSDSINTSILYRLTVLNITGSTDYASNDPDVGEEYYNGGILLQVGFRF